MFKTPRQDQGATKCVEACPDGEILDGFDATGKPLCVMCPAGTFQVNFLMGSTMVNKQRIGRMDFLGHTAVLTLRNFEWLMFIVCTGGHV
jgi:hypothetical protein